MKLRRRHFIALGFTALGGAVGLAGADFASRKAGGPGIGDAVTLLAEPELFSAERIGRAWLRENPAEANEAALEQLLAPLPADVRAAGSLRDPAVRGWLQERQRADFAANRIVQLEGWWLAETEARFCALLSLA